MFRLPLGTFPALDIPTVAEYPSSSLNNVSNMPFPSLAGGTNL